MNAPKFSACLIGAALILAGGSSPSIAAPTEFSPVPDSGSSRPACAVTTAWIFMKIGMCGTKYYVAAGDITCTGNFSAIFSQTDLTLQFERGKCNKGLAWTADKIVCKTDFNISYTGKTTVVLADAPVVDGGGGGSREGGGGGSRTDTRVAQKCRYITTDEAKNSGYYDHDVNFQYSSQVNFVDLEATSTPEYATLNKMWQSQSGNAGSLDESDQGYTTAQLQALYAETGDGTINWPDGFDPTKFKCRWRGTAPFCKGNCKGEETEIMKHKSGGGQPCATGSKAYCCLPR